LGSACFSHPKNGIFSLFSHPKKVFKALNSPEKNSHYLQRRIDSYLLDWANTRERKPLLLRGARQVGKSSAIRHLSGIFGYFLEVNFELDTAAKAVFSAHIDPVLITERLSVLYNTPIIEGKTLLFLDEIQACPEAISSLRFFYEKIPGLHVVAAGSLLEFALSELPSFGVGRIRSLFMYPFSFEEFLAASGEEMLIKMMEKADPLSPLDLPLHLKLERYLRTFLVLGGMPEVVSAYLRGKTLIETQAILNDLLISYRSDFSKYKKRVPTARIREVFESVVAQMGGKFVFAKGGSGLNLKQVKEALDLLILSGLVIPVIHSSGNGIPLGAESNPKKQKMLLLDTGLFQRILGLKISDVLISEDFNAVNKGALAELFVGLEWLKSQNPYHQENLFYWSKETGTGNAEIDYLIAMDGEVLPVEVKSSGSGSMQSMHVFLNQKNRKKGLRVSLENFGRTGNIDIIPLYAFGIKIRDIQS
jgi:predicted AAA+ superfamily ATPase